MNCGLCCEEFDSHGPLSPMLLSCGHVYCRSCFGQWAHTGVADSVGCPHCKTAAIPVLCEDVGPTSTCKRHRIVGEGWCACCSVAYCRSCSKEDFQFDATGCSGHNTAATFADAKRAWNVRLQLRVMQLRAAHRQNAVVLQTPCAAAACAMDTDSWIGSPVCRKRRLFSGFSTDAVDNSGWRITPPPVSLHCGQQRPLRGLEEEWREIESTKRHKANNVLPVASGNHVIICSGE